MTEVKKLFLVYRSNELFDLYIPQMERVLNHLGYYEVETKKFPAIADAEIKKWLQENPKLKAGVLLGDNTCHEAHPDYFVGDTIVIDKVFDFYCVWMILFGEENFSKYLCFPDNDKKKISLLEFERMRGWKDYKIYEDVNSKMLILLVSRVLKKHGMPKGVFISMDKILDHSPLSFSIFEDGESVEEVDNEEKKMRREIILKYRERAAGKLRDWFVKAGIPPEIIKIISGGLSKDEDHHGVWFVVDRHSKKTSLLAKVFHIPLGNLLEEFREAKMFEISQNEMNASLEKVCKILFQKDLPN